MLQKNRSFVCKVSAGEVMVGIYHCNNLMSILLTEKNRLKTSKDLVFLIHLQLQFGQAHLYLGVRMSQEEDEALTTYFHRKMV